MTEPLPAKVSAIIYMLPPEPPPEASQLPKSQLVPPSRPFASTEPDTMTVSDTFMKTAPPPEPPVQSPPPEPRLRGALMEPYETPPLFIPCPSPPSPP